MMKKLLFLSLIIILSTFMAYRYFSKPKNSSQNLNKKTENKKFVKITDSSGRKIKIKLPVKRVAFSHFSTGEALKILNAWDLAVTKSRNLDKNIFKNLDELPLASNQGVYDLNFEKILYQKPDIFLAIDVPMAGFDQVIKKLEPDIPVVALNFREPQTIRQNIKKLGKILQKEKEARAYIAWYDKTIKQLQSGTSLIQENKKPLVFCKTGWGDPKDIQTFTDKFPGIKERNKITGSRNAAKNLPSTGGWVQAVNPEWPASQDIDIIVVIDSIKDGYGSGIKNTKIIENHRKKIMELPCFTQTKAVKNKRVYMITGDFFGTPRFIIGFSYMAKWFHPEIFADLDPNLIHRQYLEKFLGADRESSSQGVFTFP